MDQGSLVIEQIDAGSKFLSAFRQYAPVQSAFWVKDAEDGSWSLYVASDQITDENFDVGYGEVLRIAGELHDPWFDPFQVKLIGTDHSMAKAALALLQRYPGRVATRFNGPTFGGVGVEGVYIYPQPVAVS
jgi:hypothetical protein